MVRCAGHVRPVERGDRAVAGMRTSRAYPQRRQCREKCRSSGTTCPATRNSHRPKGVSHDLSGDAEILNVPSVRGIHQRFLT